MEKNEVNEAFKILLEEIESVANKLKETGAEAFKRGNYEKASQAIEQAKRLGEFKNKVKYLQKEWLKFFQKAVKPKTQKNKRKGKNKIARGLRTPEKAFRRPILEALIELGGAARLNDVLNIVKLKMKDILTPYDHQPLPSKPEEVRWINTARWCRNTLVREGLMKKDSPYGIWEISDEGKKWLESSNIEQ